MHQTLKLTFIETSLNIMVENTMYLSIAMSCMTMHVHLLITPETI